MATRQPYHQRYDHHTAITSTLWPPHSPYHQRYDPNRYIIRIWGPCGIQYSIAPNLVLIYPNLTILAKTCHIWRHVTQMSYIGTNAAVDKKQHSTNQKSLRHPGQQLLLKHWCSCFWWPWIDLWPMPVIFLDNKGIIPGYLHIEFVTIGPHVTTL